MSIRLNATERLSAESGKSHARLSECNNRTEHFAITPSEPIPVAKSQFFSSSKLARIRLIQLEKWGHS